MDYIEHRLDLAYLLLKELHRRTKIFLYNYLYINERQASEAASDLVIAVDPLNDKAEFWQTEESVKANALFRLTKKWLAVIYREEDDNTRLFLRDHLEERMEKYWKIPLEKDSAVLWIGRKKEKGWKRFGVWENENSTEQTRVISSLRDDLIS